MKQFILRVIQLTHNQWIYCNFVLHNMKQGFLCLKARDQLLVEIEMLMDIDPEQIPPESCFLLEFDYDNLCRSGFESQQYWVVAAKAAITAGSRRAVTLARPRWLHNQTFRRKTHRERLGILNVERQIRADGVHLVTSPLDKWR